MAWRTTESADVDIAALEMYGTTQFGRRVADQYVDHLFEVFELLAANPKLARERDEVVPPMRLYRFRAHHILYILDNEDVLVLRVLSNRQDWLHQL